MATRRSLLWTAAATLMSLLAFAVGWVVARAGIGSAVDPASLPVLQRQFTERMRGSTMVGFFTVTGRENRQARPDRYDISSVERVGADRWRFNARMRYGAIDVTLPVAVTMRWVDDTPMILMTGVTIPTLGTFDVRLLFSGDRYAGTWQHGAIGGHMFGRIEKQTGAGASAP